MDSKGVPQLAVYRQERTARARAARSSKVHLQGLRVRLNYQPNKHLYGTLSYSYIDASSSAPFQSDGGVANVLTGETANYNTQQRVRSPGAFVQRFGFLHL